MATGEDRVNVGVLAPYARGPSPTPQAKVGLSPTQNQSVLRGSAEVGADRNFDDDHRGVGPALTDTSGRCRFEEKVEIRLLAQVV